MLQKLAKLLGMGRPKARSGAGVAQLASPVEPSAVSPASASTECSRVAREEYPGGAAPNPTAPNPTAAREVFFARFTRSAPAADKPARTDLSAMPARTRSLPASRLHRIPLGKLGLFGRKWQHRLVACGVHDAARFIELAVDDWRRRGMQPAEVRKLRRWQHAVRLAASMPSMKPYEAMMLFAIHRRRLRRLAAERPGQLHRDLVRFALSSPGQRLLRSRPVPDRHRVKGWIDAARSLKAGASPAGTNEAETGSHIALRKPLSQTWPT